MKKIFLFQLSPPTKGYGGMRTYVEQLRNLYKSMGYNAYIVGISNTDKPYQHFDIMVTRIQALSLAQSYECIIAYGIHGTYENLILSIGDLARCPLIVHDPAEMGPYLKQYKGKLITLRKRNHEFIKETLGLESTLLKMPHNNTIMPPRNKNGKMLSMFTMKYRKHPEIIFDAIENYNLPVDYYGTYNNESRTVDFHVLRHKYPNWRNHWKGEFNGPDKMAFINEYQYFIDMTNVKNHGGFQYTNLECFAAGTPIIINRKFYLSDGYENKSGENCFPISNARELKDLVVSVNMKEYTDVVNNGYDLAHEHHVENKNLQKLYAEAMSYR